jgi:ubiquinone/menaquinone biosynthesis C-methylase UbiE
MLARRVGATGAVVGVDRDARSLAVAREAFSSHDAGNVSWVEADLEALPFASGAFDAAVGRRVLMYQRDAASTLRAVARCVRSDGLLVLQEVDASMVPASSAPLPLHRRVHAWIWRTVEHEGANLHMGLDLASAVGLAGLVLVELRAEAVVQTPTRRLPTAAMVRAVLPRIVASGVATADEIEVDTLDQRLADELCEANTSYVGDMVFGVWARTAAATT